jgi:hypothetical protein
MRPCMGANEKEGNVRRKPLQRAQSTPKSTKRQRRRSASHLVGPRRARAARRRSRGRELPRSALAGGVAGRARGRASVASRAGPAGGGPGRGHEAPHAAARAARGPRR